MAPGRAPHPRACFRPRAHAHAIAGVFYPPAAAAAAAAAASACCAPAAPALASPTEPSHRARRVRHEGAKRPLWRRHDPFTQHHV